MPNRNLNANAEVPIEQHGDSSVGELGHDREPASSMSKLLGRNGIRRFDFQSCFAFVVRTAGKSTAVMRAFSMAQARRRGGSCATQGAVCWITEYSFGSQVLWRLPNKLVAFLPWRKSELVFMDRFIVGANHAMIR